MRVPFLLVLMILQSSMPYAYEFLFSASCVEVTGTQFAPLAQSVKLKDGDPEEKEASSPKGAAASPSKEPAIPEDQRPKAVATHPAGRSRSFI